jgi:hypothetical protein
MLAHQSPAKKKGPMDSNTLLKLGFYEWKPFAKATIEKAPESRGVYAFRSLKPLNLRTDSSDITYIGRAMSDKKGAYHNIKHSLNEYLHPGHDNPTKKRVGEKALAEGWQVSWMLTDSPDHMECHLLRQFYHDYGQLPSENKRWPPECEPEQ